MNKPQQDTYDSVMALPLQCLDAFNQAKTIKLPAKYKSCKRILLAGMGGSNLGLRMIRSVYLGTFNKPVDLANHYTLPAYADKQTLVIAMSYSGNTEESLMVAQQAHKKRCPVLVMATGGKLIEWAKHYKLPHVLIAPNHNPSKQPRLGIGYTLFALLPVFAQLGVKVNEREVKQVVQHLTNLSEDWDVEESELVNPAKKFAKLLHGFVPVFVTAEHLHGNGRIANNQTHETAKSFACEFPIPELNHHLMEGLKNPNTFTQRLRFVAFNSDKYSARIQKRFAITKEVVEQQGIKWLEFKPQGKTKLAEACEVLLFSSLLTFHLSVLYHEDPTVVPWVDYFKKELERKE